VREQMGACLLEAAKLLGNKSCHVAS
jgi:hypothetical protein